MVKQVWKYPLKLSGCNSLEIPENSIILTVQLQNEQPCMWALVNPYLKKEIRSFEIFATGQDIHIEWSWQLQYVNTFQMNSGSLVFHLFERNNNKMP